MKYYRMKQNDALQYISLQEPFENRHVISISHPSSSAEGLRSSTAFSLIKALRVDQ